VALFLGLTVAAEEIIRDRKILAREKFLDLSWASYLYSKIGILFLISAMQTLLFTCVGNAILDIEGLGLTHWALLFSTSCFANVLGLNVSASFNSAKVIYIIIPVLIIPQLLFSGIIVRFDKLHPWFASEKHVPWIGNIMASRWAYEGLAVDRFVNNAYERGFYAFDQRMKTSNWKKDLWVRELGNRVAEVRRGLNDPGKAGAVAADLALLRTELGKEMRQLRGFKVPGIDRLRPGQVDGLLLDEVDRSLGTLTQHYRNAYKLNEQAKEKSIAQLTRTPEDRAAYFALLDAHRNESLADFVTNKNDVNVIVESDGGLVQKSDPVYLEPVSHSFFDAHFYAPVKWFLGQRVPTAWANMLVLWGMSVLFALALYANLFPKVMERLSRKPWDMGK